jgi:HEAT repeat protein
VIVLLQDEYSYARMHATIVLKNYVAKADPVLLNLLNDPDSQVRGAVTNALSKIGYKAAGTNGFSP